MTKLGQKLIAAAKEARTNIRLDREIAEMQRDIELAKRTQRTRKNNIIDEEKDHPKECKCETCRFWGA